MVRKLGVYDEPDKLDPLTEVDDMTLVDFLDATRPSP